MKWGESERVGGAPPCGGAISPGGGHWPAGRDGDAPADKWRGDRVRIRMLRALEASERRTGARWPGGGGAEIGRAHV